MQNIHYEPYKLQGQVSKNLPLYQKVTLGDSSTPNIKLKVRSVSIVKGSIMFSSNSLLFFVDQQQTKQSSSTPKLKLLIQSRFLNCACGFPCATHGWRMEMKEITHISQKYHEQNPILCLCSWGPNVHQIEIISSVIVTENKTILHFLCV